jgi:hypothetical protein
MCAGRSPLVRLSRWTRKRLRPGRYGFRKSELRGLRRRAASVQVRPQLKRFDSYPTTCFLIRFHVCIVHSPPCEGGELMPSYIYRRREYELIRLSRPIKWPTDAVSSDSTSSELSLVSPNSRVIIALSDWLESPCCPCSCDRQASWFL